MKRAFVAGALLAGTALISGSPAQAACNTWHAASADQRKNVGPVEVGGGHGYGSGNHQATKKSPPQPPGAYGDPQRRAAQGGYIEADLLGAGSFRVDAFGPLDETDNNHTYDTSGGACVSVAGTDVDTGEQYIPTSAIQRP